MRKLIFFIFCCVFFYEGQGTVDRNELEAFLEKQNFLTLFQKSGVNVKLGAGLRFHYQYIQQNSEEQKHRSQMTSSQFVYDVFLLQLAANYQKAYFNFQFRFYPKFNGGPMPAYGFLGYKFNENHNFHLGLIQKPFSLPNCVHGNAASAMNYLGWEDGGGLGFLYIFKQKKYEIELAFFKNNYPRGLGDDTHKFFYGPVGDEETNWVNGRLFYHFDEKLPTNIGFSFDYGGLYNNRDSNFSHTSLKEYALKTNQESQKGSYGQKFAVALHGEYSVQNWNFRLAYVYYEFIQKDKPYLTNQAGIVLNDAAVLMAENSDVYLVYPKGHMGFLGAAYTFKIARGILQKISIHNDFSFLTKGNKWNEKTTLANTSGANIDMGVFILRPEFTCGKNHAGTGDLIYSLNTGATNPKSWDYRANMQIAFVF